MVIACISMKYMKTFEACRTEVTFERYLAKFLSLGKDFFLVRKLVTVFKLFLFFVAHKSSRNMVYPRCIACFVLLESNFFPLDLAKSLDEVAAKEYSLKCRVEGDVCKSTITNKFK